MRNLIPSAYSIVHGLVFLAGMGVPLFILHYPEVSSMTIGTILTIAVNYLEARFN